MPFCYGLQNLFFDAPKIETHTLAVISTRNGNLWTKRGNGSNGGGDDDDDRNDDNEQHYNSLKW